MQVQARAKINLALDVVERMDNGYHSLDMIMAPISIYDEIEIEKSNCDMVECEGMKLPENNTVSKMIQVLKDTYHLDSSFKVSIKKHIPAQAGLGGGNLYEITKQVGADVPFCIHDKWARVKGIGEKITPIDSDWKFDVVVVKPDFGISTANAFSKWKESRPFHPDVDLVESSIREENMDLLYQTMANALEPIAFEIEPALNQVKMDMEDAGLVRILMSGSGSSMLGFSVDEDVISNACEQLKEKYDFVKIVHVGG